MSKIYTAEELSNEAYHADKKYLSSSMLKDLYEDPRSFYEFYIAKTREKKFYNMDALNLGSLQHALLLEPDTVDSLFTQDKDDTSKIYIPNLLWIKAQDLDKRLRKEKLVKKLMKTGSPEMSILGKLEGVPYKTRYDWSCTKRHMVFDLKTTSKKKVNTKEVQQELIGSMMYEISAASYMDNYEAAYGVLPEFYFIFVSTSDYSIGYGRVTTQMYEDGRLKYTHALNIYKERKKSGDWFINNLYLPEKYLHKG